MAFLSEEKLKSLGLASCGKNVLISEKSSIYNAGKIKIGNNVRIDDFCVISAGHGGIELGNYVHIAVYVSILGAGKIRISDFVGCSARVAIYSSNDDYSGKYLTNPTVPVKYTNVEHKDVVIEKHVLVGAGSIILPGVTISEGASVGALSLVNQDLASYNIYAGSPIRKIKERSRDLLEKERELLSEKQNKK